MMMMMPRLLLHFTILDEILSQTEKQRYDGWFNNVGHPSWGSIGEQLCEQMRLMLYRIVYNLFLFIHSTLCLSFYTLNHDYFYDELICNAWYFIFNWELLHTRTSTHRHTPIHSDTVISKSECISVV